MCVIPTETCEHAQGYLLRKCPTTALAHERESCAFAHLIRPKHDDVDSLLFVQDALTFTVPVGRVSDTAIANAITLGTTALGTVLIMWAALSPKGRGRKE